MNQHTLTVLEYSAVLDIIAEYAQSAAGQKKIRTLRPWHRLNEIQLKRGLYADMMEVMRLADSVPGFFVEDMAEILRKCAPQSSVLLPEDLLLCRNQLETVAEIREFFLDEAFRKTPVVQAMAQQLEACPEIRQALQRSIDVDGSVLDSASPELRRIRSEIASEERSLQRNLEHLVKDPELEEALQDHFVTMRNGRYVIPVKRDAKNAVPGLIHDQSNSGQTLFIEPGVTLAMGNHLATLKLQERDEIRRILTVLTTRIRLQSQAFYSNQDILTEFDAAAAIARWGQDYFCQLPSFGAYMVLQGARHPILLKQFREEGRDRAVIPLNLSLPRGCKVLAVTGSNTGGKTVILKTIGLLALLAQSGLPVPADDGSLFTVYDNILADIGDEQSLQANLSTFSAHVHNIAELLKESVQGRSLILLDELGSGTDPLEGGAIACGILQELTRRQALTIATTHLGMVKNYVHSRHDMTNAAVRFNTETLQPEYRLDIGRPGASHALLIARRTGMPEEVLRAAEKMMSTDHVRLEEVLSRMEADQHRLSSRAEQAEAARNEIVRDRDQLKKELSDLKKERKKLLHDASTEAEALVQNSRKDLENLLRHLREESHRRHDADLNQEADRIRKALEEKSRRLEEQKRRNAPVPAQPLPKAQLQAGRKVWIERLKAHGVIEEVQTERKQVRVHVNGLSFVMKIKELECSREADKAPAKPEVQVRLPRVAGNTSHEINVIGLRVEEAISRIEPFLNQALLAHLGELRIVHGFGTGRLRQGIQDWLRRQSYVKTYYTGREGHDAGAGGVTVVCLNQ